MADNLALDEALTREVVQALVGRGRVSNNNNNNGDDDNNNNHSATKNSAASPTDLGDGTQTVEPNLDAAIRVKLRKGETVGQVLATLSQASLELDTATPAATDDSGQVTIHLQSREGALRAVELLDESKSDWRSGRSAFLVVKGGRSQKAGKNSAKLSNKAQFGTVDETGLALAPPHAAVKVSGKALNPGSWVCFSDASPNPELVDTTAVRSGVVQTFNQEDGSGTVSLSASLLERGKDAKVAWPEKLKFVAQQNSPQLASFEAQSAAPPLPIEVGSLVSFTVSKAAGCEPAATNVVVVKPPPKASAGRRMGGGSAPVSDSSWSVASGPPQPQADGFTSETWRQMRT